MELSIATLAPTLARDRPYIRVNSPRRLLFLLLPLVSFAGTPAQPARPNLLFILAEDIGPQLG
jgi:hypothetical protein